MKLVVLMGRLLAALPDGSSGKGGGSRLPPEALTRSERPSLADVGLQVCCAACTRKAFRFFPWWIASRHFLVADGEVTAETCCDACGGRIPVRGYALALVHCPDSRVIPLCRRLLRARTG